MNSPFLVTTSNGFETAHIKQYLGIVSSNVVTGTGLFSDIAAAFSDLFGERSNSYKKQLDIIREEALKEVEIKARALGANGLLALSIDNDQISGKNTQMLMISVTATAVVLDHHSQESLSTDTQIAKTYSPERLKQEVKLKGLLEAPGDLGLSEMFERHSDVFESQPTKMHLEAVVGKLLAPPESRSIYDSELEKAINYLTIFSSEEITDVLYPMAASSPSSRSTYNVMLTLADKFHVFNEEKITELLSAQSYQVAEKALLLCRSQKPVYSNRDSHAIRQIIAAVKERFPERRDVYSKKKTFGKETQVWSCANDHENDAESDYCELCSLTKRDLPKNFYENAVVHLSDIVDNLDSVFSK